MKDINKIRSKEAIKDKYALLVIHNKTQILITKP